MICTVVPLGAVFLGEVMKKILSVILSVFVVLQLVCVCSAKEFSYGDMYTIEIPEGFEKTGEQSFANENGAILDVVQQENTDDFSVRTLTKSSIKEITTVMIEELSTALSDLGREVENEVLYADVVKHPNGQKAFTFEFKATTKSGSVEKTKYQKVYVFSCQDNIYSFTYASTGEEDRSLMDSAFDSIVIKEAENRIILDRLGEIIAMVGLFALIVIGIAKFFIKPKGKPKKTKNKKKK